MVIVSNEEMCIMVKVDHFAKQDQILIDVISRKTFCQTRFLPFRSSANFDFFVYMTKTWTVSLKLCIKSTLYSNALMLYLGLYYKVCNLCEKVFLNVK